MPRIVDHQERRRTICDVLLDVVADVGLAGATIREVADRSGWSTGVIGHYFSSRQDLLLGGLRRAADILLEYNTRVLATLEPLPALEQLLEGTVPIDARRLALCRIFFFFYVESMRDDEIRRELDVYLTGWRKGIARAVRRAQEAGDLPAELDPRAVATDLAGLVDGLAMHAILDDAVMARLREQSPVRFWVRRLAATGAAAKPLRPAAGRLAS